LPAAGAAVGVALLAVRLATVPLDQTSPVVAVVVVAIAVTVVVFTARSAARRARVRAAADAFPGSLVIPIAAEVDTAAATRWLAARLGDADLALRPDQNAIAVLDSTGLRLTDGTTTSAVIAASKLSVLPLTTVRAGSRQIDALALGVDVGDVVAPLPLVPVRSGLFAPGHLTDAELLDLSARIRDALAGSPGRF
jgi:hypothetical protein